MACMQDVFVAWQHDLDAETDFWGLRYIRPGDGGLIWRNRAACEHFQQFGFFPSATSPWPGVKSWLGPAESARLDRIYKMAFNQFGKSITEVIKSQAAQIVEVLTVFTAVSGHPHHGLVLTHYELLAVCEIGQVPSARFA